jgi:hypothetical protein
MANQWTWTGDVAVGSQLTVSGRASYSPSLLSPTVSITNFSESAGNVVTLTVTGNTYVAGQTVYLQGMTLTTNGPGLNNTVVTLIAPTNATTMTFNDPFLQGADAGGAETGTVNGADNLGVGLTVTGDILLSDIARFYVNGVGTPAVVVDAGGDVTLNSGNLTLLTTSPSTNIALTNSTAATSSVAQNSPIINLTGNNWTGVATPDTWSIQVEEFILTTNGMSVLTFSQTPGVDNSFGIVATAIPAPASFNGHTAGTNYFVPALIFGTPTVSGINYGFEFQNPELIAITQNFVVGNPVALFTNTYLQFETRVNSSLDTNGQAYVWLVPSFMGSGGSQGTATRYSGFGEPTGNGAGVVIDNSPIGNTSGTAYGIALGTPVITPTNWFGNSTPIQWTPTSGSGKFNIVGIEGAIQATGGSGAYTALNIAVQEVTLTSAPVNYLLSLNAGVAGTTNKLLVDSTGTMALAGGLATNIVTKSTTYTATSADHTINCTGTFTLTLPTTGLYVGQEFYIKNISTGTITVSSAVNIDGTNSTNLSTQYDSLTVQWDGTQYWIY